MVGIKTLKDRLSYYVRLTKEGDSIVVTDRGLPVAILHSLDSVEKDASTEERLASLAKRGLLRLPLKRYHPLKIKPVKIKGDPLSDTIKKERR
jgi:prevent-host-death family protein